MDVLSSKEFLIILAGMVGGFANIIIMGSTTGIEFPYLMRDSGGKITGIHLGFLENVFIGGLSSFILWGISSASDNEPLVYAIAILAGLGGRVFW